MYMWTKKRAIITILPIMVVIIILTGTALFPRVTKLSYKGTATEYSLTDKAIAINHRIFIEGNYYARTLGKDRFQGVFYISDVAGHECETSVVDFRFWPNDKYVPSFKDEAGQPYTTEISGIYFSNDPRKIAVQFAYMFSIAGEKLMSASSDKESSFLVVGASSREDAVSSYIELLYNSK